jgi:hypothetical protein
MNQEKIEPTVNPIIARLKAQAAGNLDTNENEASDSRFGILSQSARAALKASLDEEAEPLTISETDLIAHKGSNKSVNSATVQSAKQFPADPQYATKRLNLENVGLKAGKAEAKSGIYKMTFEDGCYIIGYAGDLYAKMVGVTSRINRNAIPRYPRGTEVLSFEVLSWKQADLATHRATASKDPKYIAKLERVKASAKSGQSLVEKYKAKKAGQTDSKAKVNPLIEAHKAEREANDGLSPLERLKAQGGKISISPVSYEIAEDALAELDAAFEDFAK